MKNKFFVLLVFCLLLCGCGNYRELNDLAIITGMGIDKEEDGYQVSFLIANSQKQQTSSKEGEAQTTVYSGTGANLTEAIKAIDSKTSKQLYFGHINIFVISEEIGEDGFLKVADRILRSPETRKQFFILQARDTKAKDILKIVSPLESFPSQNIATMIKSNQVNQTYSSDINYSQFIGQILDKGQDPVLPSITIKGDPSDGSKEKNLTSTEVKNYLKLDSLAIYRNDKFEGYASKDESQDINILKNNINEFKYSFKLKGNNISYTSDNFKTKTKVKSPNEIEIKVTSTGFVSEVEGDLNLENINTIKDLQNNLNNSIKKSLEKTLNNLQTKYKSDVLGFGNKIYKKYPDKWKDLEKKWNENGFKDLKFNISTDFTIESSGSLDQTIEEVKQ